MILVQSSPVRKRITSLRTIQWTLVRIPKQPSSTRQTTAFALGDRTVHSTLSRARNVPCGKRLYLFLNQVDYSLRQSDTGLDGLNQSFCSRIALCTSALSDTLNLPNEQLAGTRRVWSLPSRGSSRRFILIVRSHATILVLVGNVETVCHVLCFSFIRYPVAPPPRRYL